MEFIHYEEIDKDSYVKRYRIEGIARSEYDIPYSGYSDKNRLDIHLPIEEKESYPAIIYISMAAA